MKILLIFLILTLALTLGTCTNDTITFPSGVYITTLLDSYDIFTALKKLNSYSSGENSLNMSFSTGDLIVQGEKRCPPIGELKWTYVYSKPILDADLENLAIPNDDMLHLDFQLKTKKTMYEKTINPPVSVDKLYKQLIEFYNEKRRPAQKNWFYATGFGNLNTSNPTFSKLWLDQTSYYRRSSCPPDDSNLQRLCSKRSTYTCPNTTYCMKDGIEYRTMSMYIVTGKANDYAKKNCSYSAAIMDQYMANHYYFKGNNDRALKMKRTVPVIRKFTLNPPSSICAMKYQMQFFVDRDSPPCPTNPKVLLKNISNMAVYVKVFNGYASSDMNFLHNHFSQELTSKQLTYVAGQYYLSVFRGHGPTFGHRLEIWILKKTLNCTTIHCN